jgi:hypothetical protein
VREPRRLDGPGAKRWREILRRVLAALPLAASLHAQPAFAEVIDDIAIEQLATGTTRIHLRLTGPVGYVRDYASAGGETVNVYLQALAPGDFSGSPPADEVKQAPKQPGAPRFTVRVSVDPRCDAAPNPICMTIRFERAVRSRVRLGEDRRSLLLDLDTGSKRVSPPAREKP